MPKKIPFFIKKDNTVLIIFDPLQSVSNKKNEDVDIKTHIATYKFQNTKILFPSNY